MGSNSKHDLAILAPASRPGETLIYTIEEWNGGSLVKAHARCQDFSVAVAAFDAAVIQNPKLHLTMRNRAHVFREHEPK